MTGKPNETRPPESIPICQTGPDEGGWLCGVCGVPVDVGCTCRATDCDCACCTAYRRWESQWAYDGDLADLQE